MTEQNLDGDLADLVAEPAAEAVPPEPLVVPDTEPAADGLVEVSGTRINIGPIVAAERRRVEAKIRAEYEPLKQQASQLSQVQEELRALRQQIAPPKEAAAPEVSDTDAETYARRHQLYDGESKLDLKTAKSILAETRAELKRVSREAAQEALGPVHQSEAKRSAHENFMRIAATKDMDGNFVFKDPATHPALLAAWNALPDELRSVPEVGDVVVKTALGELALKHRPKAAVVVEEREPILAEAANNRGQSAYTLSAVERKVAEAAKIAPKDWEARAKLYQPGTHNSLED